MPENFRCVVENNINLTEIISVIIASINVAAVIAFFIYEKIRQKKDKINEYNLTWYKLINISERTNVLNSLIEEEILKLEELRNDTETDITKRKSKSEKIIIQFDKKIINEKNIITPIMKCISEENNKEISSKFNKLMALHDTTLINKAVLNNGIIDYSDFIDQKNLIIENFYTLGKNFLK